MIIGRKLFIVVCMSVFLTACGSLASKQYDSAPVNTQDASSVPNAVPKDEPPSKYGNPAHYDILGKRYYTLKSGQGYKEKGIASWYGTKFHGRRTSSGETYDMYAMTAAHKTLPLPSYVEVTNLQNGKKIIVKVNDRGPFHDNRVIDLSYSAATKLGIIGKGTGMVEVKVISANDYSAPTSTVKVIDTVSPVGLFLQMGAFSTRNKAQKLQQEIQSKIGDAIVIVPLSKPSGSLYRVRIGPLSNVEYADSLASRLVTLGYRDGHVVVE